jgi:rhamnosyltransferase
MGKYYTVYVMLSTYNGAKYLRTQLDSLLAQEGVDLTIRVRDDGSTDGTQAILDEYQDKYACISWYQGENKGASGSFYDLMYNSPKCEYYAFCDQDDYWHTNKLYRAVRKLENINGPCLYFSKKNIVDGELGPTDIIDEPINSVKVGAMFVRGVAYGCTEVMNLKAMELLKSHHPGIDQMHDAYAQRVIGLCGTVIYDKKSYIDYRQHGNNTIGVSMTIPQRIVNGIKNLRTRITDHRRSEIAKEFYRAFKHNMSSKNRYFIYHFAHIPYSLKSRLIILFSRDMVMQTKLETLIIKMLILLGCI